MTSSTPSAPKKLLRRKRRLIILSIVGVIVIVLAGLETQRLTQDPSAFVRNLYIEVMIHHNLDILGTVDESSTLCRADNRGQGLSMNYSYPAVEGPGDDHYDLSQVTFTTVDKQFMGTAHVQIGGSVTITDSIRTYTRRVGTQFPQNLLITLQQSWSGWCIDMGGMNFYLS